VGGFFILIGIISELITITSDHIFYVEMKNRP
jgi:hypothetical protein